VEKPNANKSENREKVSFILHFFDNKKYNKKNNAMKIRRIHITDHPPDIAGLKKIDIIMVCKSLFREISLI
jgi:hypothetical protein